MRQAPRSQACRCAAGRKACQCTAGPMLQRPPPQAAQLQLAAALAVLGGPLLAWRAGHCWRGRRGRRGRVQAAFQNGCSPSSGPYPSRWNASSSSFVSVNTIAAACAVAGDCTAIALATFARRQRAAAAHPRVRTHAPNVARTNACLPSAARYLARQCAALGASLPIHQGIPI